MKPRRPAITATLATALAALTGGLLMPGAFADDDGKRTSYIVRLDAPALASYRGGAEGLAATNPAATGKKRLDVDSPASRAYLEHLAELHDTVENAIEGAVGRPVERQHDYRYAYNGFALELTESESATVRRLSRVARVQPAVKRKLLTDAGPEWIGADTVWSGEKTAGAPGTKGEGVVVGVIDTGVNHDHPSFADVGADGYDHENPRETFYGLCDPVTGKPFCNDKLIGVWDFTGTSPEDDNQHGSHTASTAAGNHVEAVVEAPTLDVERPLAGVAPHANLITYKACTAIGSCLSPSLVAAIDQATADGVDVINYSIGGGSSDPWNDADAQAFLGAREAGIFVAASAGNSGPGAGTVGSPADAPWLTSVAASTHDRVFANAVTDMSGGGAAPPEDLAGKSFTAAYGPAPIVHAADYGDALCSTPFPPGTFDGEIVVCDRGVNPRVEKGTNVKAGGAGGMVLANTEAQGDSTVADPHYLPAVHIGWTEARKLKAWLGSGSGHMAAIAGTTADRRAENGDVTAGFSSRGPNPAAPGVLKPDISAPGVDILAAVNTTNPAAGAEYGLLSGTSMSSPHLAGAAALVRALHPSWTPAQIQSALMTTAVRDSMRKEDGSTAADAFDMGAGRVDLTRAGRAGLLLNEDGAAYRAADPAQGGDPSRLNLPSLASADCAGTCTWTRTVDNALPTRAVWDVSTSAPEGMELSVKPRRISLEPGASATITVTADVSRLPAGEWRFAGVTLTEKQGAAPEAYLPVAVLPGGSSTPVDVTASDTSGTHTVALTAPVRITDLTATVRGLQRGTVTTEKLVQDPTPLDPYDGTPGTYHTTMEVPVGARLLTARIAETTSSDLDLFVGLDADGDGAPDAGEEVCRSASATAMESCRLDAPAGGTYWVMVQNWLTGQAVDDVELVAAAVPGGDNGNLTVRGQGGVVAEGEEHEVTLAWDEPRMEPGTAWFAVVELAPDRRSPAGSAGSLFVRIDRP